MCHPTKKETKHPKRCLPKCLLTIFWQKFPPARHAGTVLAKCCWVKNGDEQIERWEGVMKRWMRTLWNWNRGDCEVSTCVQLELIRHVCTRLIRQSVRFGKECQDIWYFCYEPWYGNAKHMLYWCYGQMSTNLWLFNVSTNLVNVISCSVLGSSSILSHVINIYTQTEQKRFSPKLCIH